MMTKKLWLVWKEPNSLRRYVVGELEQTVSKYIFKYTNPELDDAIKVGFEYFPGFSDLKEIYENSKMFSNIETRLPNPTRPDYLEILNIYGLEKDSDVMEILKITKGRLLTDNFEFVPVFEKNKIEFDIAGTKYYEAKNIKNQLMINDDLFLVLEPDNTYDKYAIKVVCIISGEERKLGYVPRYYSEYLTDMLKNNIKYSAKIKSLNFDSPLDDEDITAGVKLIFDID